MKTQNQHKPRYQGGIIVPFIVSAGILGWIVACVIMYN